MRIVENPKHKQFSDFVKTIHQHFDKAGTIIYQKRNEIRVFDVCGVRINVKRFKIPHLLNRIVYTFVRKSKARRSFQYAIRLKEMGIETPEPVAYVLTKRGGLLHYSYYISLQVDHYRALSVVGEGIMNDHEPVLEALASFTADIHKKGIYHKDYSSENILFKETDGDVSFCLIDLNRIRFGRVSVLKGCANFARIGCQRPFFECIVRKYAEQRHANAEPCLKIALQARRTYWSRFARKYPTPFVWDG